MVTTGQKVSRSRPAHQATQSVMASGVEREGEGIERRGCPRMRARIREPASIRRTSESPASVFHEDNHSPHGESSFLLVVRGDRFLRLSEMPARHIEKSPRHRRIPDVGFPHATTLTSIGSGFALSGRSRVPSSATSQPKRAQSWLPSSFFVFAGMVTTSSYDAATLGAAHSSTSRVIAPQLSAPFMLSVLVRMESPGKA